MIVCYYVLYWLRNYKGRNDTFSTSLVVAEMTHFQRHWLFVNMPFTKEGKILSKNLFELKGYNVSI